MNQEERDLISRFVARVGGGVGLPNGQGPSSLPPIDPEADRFIGENFQRYPEARYRITQLAVVQEAALSQAQARIRDLEFQLQQARGQIAQLQQQQASQPGQQGGQSSGFFSGLFGRGQTAPPPRGASLPPGWGPASGAAAPEAGRGYQPTPGYQPGMFGRSGSGFLGSALSTAAGVAGGMMAANALEGLFSGGHGYGHGGMGADGDGFGGGDTTIINNNYGDAGGDGAGFAGQDADPFAGSGTEAEGFSQQDFGPQDAPADDGGGDFGGDDGGGFGGGDDFF